MGRNVKLLLVVVLATVCPLLAVDEDRDGLDDTEEQELLERFRPAFLLSRSDCGGKPAAFEPDRVDPVAIPGRTAIYGQAFPAAGGVELHYFHLWTVDCGRLGHPWDVEHIAGLVRGGKAVYWLAAAHQSTVCDAAHGARAKTLGAIDRGPVVWVSRGKHASFFSEKACVRGCGGDRCEAAEALDYTGVINLGEKGAPLNGALWTASKVWLLHEKLVTDFSPGVLAQLDRNGIVTIDPAKIPVQSVILGGNSAVDGIARGKSESESAVGTATDHTGRAMGRAYRWVRKRLPQ